MEHEKFQGITMKKLACLSDTDQIIMDLSILRNLNSLSHLAQIRRIIIIIINALFFVVVTSHSSWIYGLFPQSLHVFISHMDHIFEFFHLHLSAIHVLMYTKLRQMCEAKLQVAVMI